MIAWLMFLVACYTGEMSLQRWEITAVMEPDTTDYVAATWADPQYLQAEVYFNVPEMKLLDSSAVRRTVVHELVHVLLWELDLPERAEEQLATWIERLPHWQQACN